ncbi:hypothetical protein BBP40_008784 [Aspergillus hancockii]|nr:hypothetical protein BBP40_008784 [Aspergillus hancockii]
MAMKTLVRFSLVETKQQSGSYAIHPGGQDLGHMAPSRNDKAHWELARRLLPHANQTLGMLSGRLSGRDDAVFKTMYRLGSLFRHQGKYTEVEQMYQHALAGKENSLSCGHLDTLMTVYCLENLYTDQGKLNEAEHIAETSQPT